MKNAIVNSLMDNVSKYKNFNDVKLKEIRYGIESFYLTITKTVVIFTLSYICGTFKTLLLLMIFYTLLRLNGFGLHAKKSWQCWLGSIILFLIVPYLCLHLYIGKSFMIIISLFCLIFILKYAPADTEKRPIVNRKKRLIHKSLCILTTIAYILIIYLLKDLYLCNIIFFSIFIETVMILPLSYKIFRLKYDNYKHYLFEH